MDQGSVFDNTEYVRDGGDHDLVILAVMAVFRKAPRKYLYVLWLVAALRLVCPVGAGERDEPVQSEPDPSCRVGGRHPGVVRSCGSRDLRRRHRGRCGRQRPKPRSCCRQPGFGSHTAGRGDRERQRDCRNGLLL